MKVELKKLNETEYCNLTDSKEAFYCEITYNRDKSSFAGLALETRNNSGIFFDNCNETVIKQLNKYEKIYMGMDKSYCESLMETYENTNTYKGFKILFLIYSDVKSSQIVFERLMEWIIQNIY